MTCRCAILLRYRTEKRSRGVDFAEGVADHYEDCEVDASNGEGGDKSSKNGGK